MFARTRNLFSRLAAESVGQGVMHSPLSKILIALAVAALTAPTHAGAENAMTPLQRAVSTPKRRIEESLYRLRQCRRGRPQDLPVA